MSMKKLRLIFVLASMLMMVGGLPGSTWAKPVSFKFAIHIPPNEPASDAGIWISRELDKISNGKIKSKFFHSGQMGSEVEIVKKVRMGTLQGALCPATYTPDINPKFGIATLAYCLDSFEKYEALLKNDSLRDELFLSLQDKGLRCLDLCYYGQFGLVTTKPVNTLDDLKSMKMRTTQARYTLAFWKALGVNPVTMPWGDVFPSLRQRVVDGLDQTRNVTLLRLTDVCNHFTVTNHMIGVFFFLVNDKWWTKLDEESRTMIGQTITANMAKARKMNTEASEPSLAGMKAKGMKVIYLSDEEMAKFKKSQLQVWKQFEPEIGTEWLNKVKEFTSKFDSK
jgi:TRAP-type C4-dicarboxylate transport system substrate-binding protein